MSPVDKATEGEKEASEREEDLRHDWLEEDIQEGNRKPNLSEMDKDPTEMGE